MNRRRLGELGRCLVMASFVLATSWGRAEDSNAVKAIFADPPRQYASAPLWVWNDMLTEKEIVSTLHDLASQKVRQAFVHPRPGLMTPYLSADWFRLWKVALREAKRLDMNIWIYDENSYPSGFAGGWVPETMPESRGRGLTFRELKTFDGLTSADLAVYRLTEDGFENVTDKARGGAALPADRYVAASVVRAKNATWTGNRCYVDLLYPGVTQKFLEITLDAYRREIGDQFGKRVPGSFTDEPQIRPAGGLPWTDRLPEEFQKRWGYSLIDNLPALNRPLGNWRQVRHDYYQLLLEQFIERWAKPYYEYCAKNNLEFTGHYWDHEWPNCIAVPDSMAMSAWQQRPGIDCLMNQYSEGTHAQFGNVRMVKELSSVANQLGRPRTLCELYGAGGWDLRFEDMKRIGDWLEVLGVNMFDEHLSYVTIRGARKRDHPQSFSYHEPWWEAYHVMATYFTRLTAAMSSGQQINEILVIEPTTTAWMYQNDKTQAANLQELGDRFFELLMSLERAQIEYDIGCENIIADHGKVEAKSGAAACFVVGQRSYSTVVLPPLTESLNAKTMEMLEAYARKGGRVICCGPAPALVDARPSDRGADAAKSAAWKQLEPGAVAESLRHSSGSAFAIQRADGDKGILFHHRRRLDDGQIVLLVNTSIESPSSGDIAAKAKGVERWNCETGKVAPYPFASSDDGVKCSFDLPPCGSLLLFLSNSPRKPAPAVAERTSTIPAKGAPKIRRLDPNVLTLDYVDVTAGGETKENLYFYDASKMAFVKNGMKDGNPWDSAVQFKDEIISKKFPAGSGLEATYRFTIAGSVPKPLTIVIERPDLYTITCNGKPVSATKRTWWLDKAFGRINISAAAQTGENAVTIKASPFTIYHELEPAYVLGDFSLKSVEAGFVIEPPTPLRLEQGVSHSNERDRVAWLSAGIGYRRDSAKSEDDDPAPWVVFDLGRTVNVSGIRVWNYNEANLTARGVKDVEIAGSVDGAAESFTIPVGKFELARANGSSGSSYPQALRVDARGVRCVKFKVLSNHNGVSYPATAEALDNAFAGLSEVQFFESGKSTESGAPVEGAAIHAVSSELSTPGGHDRKARYLVDGSGLTAGGLGWDRQGCPFYGAGVAYSETFAIARPTGRYRVSLPNWYGSVAKVMVNGKPAGYVACQPWTLDVTDAIKRGTNTIEVVVIGTLKNTLGPHHAGALVGSAWPGSFRQAPKNGPPAGSAYHTLGYGLFAPFVLEQVAQ